MPRFYDQVPAALAAGQPFALGIITGIKGSSPQKQGAKALFFYDGRIQGTLGGGCLEAEIQDRARRALLSGQAARFDLILDHDFGWDDGLICGGKVSGLILPRAAEAAEMWCRLAASQEPLTWGVRQDYSLGWAGPESDEWIYRETVLPPCPFWVAGSGHVAQAVVPLALQLDFQVTVFDDRPALANHEFFPAATQFKVGYWEEILSEPLPSRPTFGLIVTRGHQHDALVLRHWVGQAFTFLGMIGSRRKRRLIFDQFLRDGLASAEQLDRVQSPVGLPILAHSVPEIAVSILAECIQQRAARVFGRQLPPGRCQ